MTLEPRFSANGTGKEKEIALPERHRKADQALAERYKRLAQKWADAEGYFRSLHLPIPIYTAYNITRFDGGDAWDCLAFTRYRGEWRLCHAHCNSLDDDDEQDWKPIVDSATNVRIDAAAQLAKLKIEAAKAKEEYVSKVDNALENIDNCLAD